jgi:hypothetical protein
MARERRDRERRRSTRFVLGMCFGLWMLVGGVAAAIWAVRYVWPLVAALPAYAAVVGFLLILEAIILVLWPRRPVEAASVTEPPSSESPQGGLRIPVLLHRILDPVLALPGSLGGAVVGVYTYFMTLAGLLGEMDGWWLLPAGVLFLMGSATGGLEARRLFRRYVRVR